MRMPLRMNGSVLGSATVRNASHCDPPKLRVISRWRLDAGGRRDHHCEERRKEDDDDLGLEPDARDEHDERDERDVRRRVQGREQRACGVVHAPEPADGETKGDRDDQRDEESDRELLQAEGDVRKDRAVAKIGHRGAPDGGRMR
jgi:hypothetical protein